MLLFFFYLLYSRCFFLLNFSSFMHQSCEFAQTAGVSAEHRNDERKKKYAKRSVWTDRCKRLVGISLAANIAWHGLRWPRAYILLATTISWNVSMWEIFTDFFFFHIVAGGAYAKFCFHYFFRPFQTYEFRRMFFFLIFWNVL